MKPCKCGSTEFYFPGDKVDVLDQRILCKKCNEEAI